MTSAAAFCTLQHDVVKPASRSGASSLLKIKAYRPFAHRLIFGQALISSDLPLPISMRETTSVAIPTSSIVLELMTRCSRCVCRQSAVACAWLPYPPSSQLKFSRSLCPVSTTDLKRCDNISQMLNSTCFLL